MLVIRLARTGRRNQATFRVVLQEKTQSPKSKSLETLGSYHPHLAKREDQFQLHDDRIRYWLERGAKASATMHNFFIERGLLSGAKQRVVRGKKKKEEIATTAAPTPQPEETPTPTPEDKTAAANG